MRRNCVLPRQTRSPKALLSWWVLERFGAPWFILEWTSWWSHLIQILTYATKIIDLRWNMKSYFPVQVHWFWYLFFPSSKHRCKMKVKGKRNIKKRTYIYMFICFLSESPCSHAEVSLSQWQIRHVRSDRLVGISIYSIWGVSMKAAGNVCFES